MNGQYALTLIMDRGKTVCKRKIIPNEFVFFDLSPDEEQPIVLQCCKERVEALVRSHVGEIQSD